MTEEHITAAKLRSFGLIVGGVFGAVALWPITHGQELRWWALMAAALFIIPAIAVPSTLRPIHRVWMFIGQLLGWINTRIILSIGFYVIVMPVGLAMRAFGVDPMHCRYLSETKTYRIPRTSRSGGHMRQQF